MIPPTFIWKKTCDTCRVVKKQLDAWGVEYLSREMNAEPLTGAELDALIGAREVKPFLNPRNEQYRALGLARDVPDKARAVALIAEHNNLLRRPVMVWPDAVVIGKDLPALASRLGVPQ